MKKIKLIPLILLLCLVLGAVSPAAFALEEPPVEAQAVVLADMASGRILYSRNMDQQRSPASLTKIMTALIAVEELEAGNHSLDEIVTAPIDCRQGLDDDSSTVFIQYGEELTYEQLLYCALVASANEACNVIGSCISGSISAFVDRMNVRAAELGCANTHFADPNGLSSDNLTTAYDFYLITRAALGHAVFAAICNTPNYTVPATNLSEPRELHNSNALICTGSIYGDGYLYEGAAGVKTGFTQAAGYCLISTAERENVHLLAVVMGCDGVNNSSRSDYGNFVDSIALYDWAFANFAYHTVLTSADSVTRVNVQYAEDEGLVLLRPVQDVTVLLPADTADSPEISYELRIDESKLIAPIEAGTVLGEADVTVSGIPCGTIQLVNAVRVDMAKGEFIRQRMNAVLQNKVFRTIVILLAVLLIGYFMLITRYRYLRRKHLKERKAAERRRRMEMENAYSAGSRSVPPVEPTQRFSAVPPDERDK